MTLYIEQELPVWAASGAILHGWALAVREGGAGYIMRIQQGLADWQTRASGLWVSHSLALLTEASMKTGQAEEGLTEGFDTANLQEAKALLNGLKESV